MGGSASRSRGARPVSGGFECVGGSSESSTSSAVAADPRRQQEIDDEAFARRMVMEDMLAGVAGASAGGAGGGMRIISAQSLTEQQQARAACPFCSVENVYSAAPGSGAVALRCGNCSRHFQARLPSAGDHAGAAAASGADGSSLHICRRCGTMNQFPTPPPRAPMPNIQCGSCGGISPALRRRAGGRGGASAETRLIEQMLSSGAGVPATGAGAGPLVRINMNGQRRVVPLSLLLALMAEEQRGNSANSSDIDALPTRKLEGNAPLGEQNKCLICLEDFGDGDDVKTLPCLHIYHQKCVERWLHTDNSCPVCKTPIGQAAFFDESSRMITLSAAVSFAGACRSGQFRFSEAGRSGQKATMVMFSHRIQEQSSGCVSGANLDSGACPCTLGDMFKAAQWRSLSGQPLRQGCWCFERDWFFLVLVMLRSDDVRPPLADVLQVRNVIILTF
eukprot:CAMPEP_0203974822 /NCGR_PEP_ID=MMETSP0359-20131031/100298_1 /ASSEMBLY_ACC=CAM_ASM_000338 /TAXON_ID=268821 /ORGANISM="Scrippsiella Hangoei, Strain SHTV-5" /LENGTH=448 /DNA_ID=CAMNT_0050913011 /DNA_START=36 /DNA_END=1384 /DNA_ORIENTATION=+